MKTYRIFYNQHVLSISSQKDNPITEKEKENCLIFHQNDFSAAVLFDFLCQEINIQFICTDDIGADHIFSSLRKTLEHRLAAGGIVFKDEAILAIFRRNFWDFPKGHVDTGESDQEAAIREVSEETGIDKLSITADLGYTYHIYSEQDQPQFLLKTTHWFAMRTESLLIPTPQISEDIIRAEWIPLREIEKIRQNTYPSIKELLDRANLVQETKKW